MTTPTKRGRIAVLIDAVRISLTLPRADVTYLREHFPSASEGVRELIKLHKTGDTTTRWRTHWPANY